MKFESLGPLEVVMQKKNLVQNNERRLLLISSLGGTLEYYDFIIFALFAVYISEAIFPATEGLLGLMLTFATFAIGYLIRPLGGIVFGHFGDRIGRKASFTVSILLMAFATLGIGIVPSYAILGFGAPLLVVFFRLLQGFSIGGEIPGAITYVTESLSHYKGLACGIVFCALTLGVVIGSILYALLVTLLDPTQLHHFGWRIPFILGGFFGLLSFFLRRNLSESTPFLALENEVEKYPILSVCKKEWPSLLCGIMLVALSACIVSSLFLFLPAYFTKVLNLPDHYYIWQQTFALAVGAVLNVCFGYVSDIWSLKKLTMLLILLTLILAYPIFMIYAYYPSFYPLALGASTLLLGISAGVIPRALSELYPISIRYSGIALSYNLGFALFGGLTPFISLSLIYYTKWLTAPAWYLMGVTLLTFFCLKILGLQQKIAWLSQEPGLELR